MAGRGTVHILPVALLLAGCGRLDELLVEPPITPQQWCARRPCRAVGGLVFGEPLGSLLVFLLAVLWVVGGIQFLRDHRRHRSRAWLGIALVLGGVGAGSAGISFQAFGYALKCAGRKHCLLTTAFEVGYGVAQAVSVAAMLTAVAYACAVGPWRRGLIGFAALNAVAYLVVAMAGVMLPNRTLLSFEVLMLFALPGLALVTVVAGRRYWKSGGAMDGSLLVAALLLVVVQIAYFAYAAAGITEQLWNGGQGFYLSENEVLHLGMIGWLAYTLTIVRRHLRDETPPVPVPRSCSGSRR